MSSFNARKSTIKTIEKNGFDRSEFDAWMADFGYTTKEEYGCIAVVDEDGISVDWAHPAIITYKGERYGVAILSEMETTFNLGDEWFNTINDDVNISLR